MDWFIQKFQRRFLCMTLVGMAFGSAVNALAGERAIATSANNAKRLVPTIALLLADQPVVVSGNGKTISGSGFGNKANAAPIKFDTFESYTTGQAGTTISGYFGGGSTSVVSTRTHSGSKAMQWVMPLVSEPPPQNIVPENFPEFGIVPPAGVKKLYNSFYQYLEQTHTATHLNYGDPYYRIAQDIRVFKQWRAGSGTQYTGRPQFHDTQGMNDALVVSGHDFGVFSDTNINYGGQPSSGGASGGKWNFCEYFADLGTPGIANGSFIEKINGVITLNVANVQLLAAGNHNTQFDWLYMFVGADYYWDTAYAVTSDDWYVDSTFARVVMTDSALYANASKWAVQPATAWSNTSIQIQTRRGGFNIGDTAYYHVFNAAGALVHSSASFVVAADAG